MGERWQANAPSFLHFWFVWAPSATSAGFLRRPESNCFSTEVASGQILSTGVVNVFALENPRDVREGALHRQIPMKTFVFAGWHN
ncbi:hypothetical protein Q31a_15240 [Aureliella helgolandensis]|uniref:Uncharacterized protein n=1 Tax=Aureliella helgolandensis TaxID=2527968 RepID=A0A518G3Q0_9BACT|nr:hypothetical protein Q31a_15240 [Aureliella helgolandensis]